MLIGQTVRSTDGSKKSSLGQINKWLRIDGSTRPRRSVAVRSGYASFAIPNSSATWSSPRSSAGAIGMPSRARFTLVSWLRSPGT